MPTDTPSNLDRLSPAWIRRPLSRRSTSPLKETSPTTANGFLAPEPARSNSDESRSARSISSRRGSVREIVKRLRSSSNVSTGSNKSQDIDLSEVENWFHGFRKYNQLVSNTSLSQAYPSKEFTKASKSLTKNCGGQFLHGLPEAVFDLSLLWCPAGHLTRKENTDEPSWSWTAYKGPVSFPFDPSTCPDIYTAPRSEGEWVRSEVVNYHIGPQSDQYTVRREKGTNSLRLKYPPWFHAPRGADYKTDSNTLRFTAATISAEGFTAEQLEHDGKEIPCSHLINEDDQHCGVIMDYESSISQPSSTGPYEFILLSRNLWRKPSPENRRPVGLTTMHPSGTPIWSQDHFLWDEVVDDFAAEQFEAGPWKMLNVMLIKWVGEHAERVAIARIHEDAWNQRDPVRKCIVLR
ncbi:hypothetical protein yc1106_08880 [Curvularia clavata]|uniref:Uncharacterized protein n=1 Tax=Curvularia clavata TaxID=95742 RepID=A0A9Q9DXK2_CURCL|nr:hypothetical protein yc1106_08880 [Curvularia clavata]